MIHSIIQHIAKQLNMRAPHYAALPGGDINQCFCLFTPEQRYFLKLNNDQSLRMFEKEADGLSALRTVNQFIIPEVISHGTVYSHQWLLLQWLQKQEVTESSLQVFGRQLARMHRQPQPFFGWHTDNYIGSVIQLNIHHTTWAIFYAECRILPLVAKLFNSGAFSKQDLDRAVCFAKQLPDLLPEEPAALLHGDLWSGNYMITVGGAAIFDPAVYFGHREMDIGMTRLFGGFSHEFYEGYEEIYPMEKGWQERLSVTQLYPLLVHAVLFGGQYIDTCRQLLKKWG